MKNTLKKILLVTIGCASLAVACEEKELQGIFETPVKRCSKRIHLMPSCTPPRSPSPPPTPISWENLLETFQTNPYYTKYSDINYTVAGLQTHLPVFLDTLESIEKAASSGNEALQQQMQLIINTAPGGPSFDQGNAWCIWSGTYIYNGNNYTVDFRIYPLLRKFLVMRSQRSNISEESSWCCWHFRTCGK